MQNNQDKGQYVDNATFVNQVLKENTNVNKKALQIAISKLKNELFNGKAEDNLNQQEKQTFLEKRQQMTDKYKQQATISLERNGQYVSNADFIKEFCKKNKIMNKKNLTNAISKLKCKLFKDKDEALFTQDDIDRWQQSRLEKANELLSTLYTRKKVNELCQENPNINKSNILLSVKRKRNKKAKQSGKPTNEEDIKDMIDEYRPRKKVYTYDKYSWVDDFCKKYKQDKKSVITALQNRVSHEKNRKDNSVTEEQLKDWLYGEYAKKNAEKLLIDDCVDKSGKSRKQVLRSIQNKLSLTKSRKNLIISRDAAVKWFLETHPLQEGKHRTEQQINSAINLNEEENNDLNQDKSNIIRLDMEEIYGSEMNEDGHEDIKNNSPTTKELNNDLEKI